MKRGKIVVVFVIIIIIIVVVVVVVVSIIRYLFMRITPKNYKIFEALCPKRKCFWLDLEKGTGFSFFLT